MFRLMKKLHVWPVVASVIFMFVGVVCDLLLPTLTSSIIDKGVAKGNISLIWKIGGLMLIITLISVMASLLNSYFSSKESMRLGKVIRSQIFTKTLYLSGEAYDSIGTSSLITRTTNDVSQVQGMLQSILHTMIMTPVMLVGSIFLAYKMDASLTKTFLLIVPVILLLMAVIFGLSVPLFSKMQKATDKLNLVFRESLTGVRVIRAFNKSKFEQKKFEKANKDYFSLGLKVNSIIALSIPLVIFVISIANAGIIWFGGHYVAEGRMEIGNLIAFSSYAMMILSSFMMVAMLVVMIPRAFASTKRINEVLDLDEMVQDPVNPDYLLEGVQESILTFTDVNYSYQNSSDLVLKNISFEINRGETVAIVGATGSGKSTILQMILRLIDPISGEIKMDNKNLKTITQNDIHSNIGYVPQKSRLFTGTIRDNIRYGKLDATDEEIWHALDIAQAKSFVEELPDGLDTIVEQDGDNFSGGQRQRLCIARAVVRKAEFYLLDDSFSALDFKTDAKLRQALLENLTGATIIIVAQRISTVKNADLILVINQGELIGKGTHDELKDNNDVYKEILYSQLKEEEIT